MLNVRQRVHEQKLQDFQPLGGTLWWCFKYGGDPSVVVGWW